MQPKNIDQKKLKRLLSHCEDVRAVAIGAADRWQRLHLRAKMARDHIDQNANPRSNVRSLSLEELAKCPEDALAHVGVKRVDIDDAIDARGVAAAARVKSNACAADAAAYNHLAQAICRYAGLPLP